MHGAVMLDENGAVLRPALIWCDTRTQPECDWLTEKIGYERLIELTCNPALPNFTLTKLLWVKTHQPEIFAKIRHIMCPKDYVRYRLTGEFAIDVQEAQRHAAAGRDASALVEGSGGGGGDSGKLAAEGVRVAGGLRAHQRDGGGADGTEGGHAGGGGRGRPGRGRGGHGHSAAGVGFGDDRHFGRGVCGDGAADEGSEGTAAHVLPCCAGSVARDGRDAIGGAEPELAEGDILCRAELRRHDGGAAKIPAGSEGLEWAPYLLGERTPHLDPRGARGVCGHLDRCIRRRILCARCWRAWLIRCKTRSRCLPSWEFR